jgi:hypothetical protein
MFRLIVLLTVVIGLIATTTTTTKVRVNNTILPIEAGTFYLYQIHNDSAAVSLQQYPAFYAATTTTYPIGTEIKNLDNATVSYVIGSDQNNYYPVTPLDANKIMHCGRYGLENVIKNRTIFIQNLSFTLNQFKDLFTELADQEYQCFVYL